MNLGQMRVLIPYADVAINNFARGNDAFDNLRERERSALEFRQNELGVGLTAFEFNVSNWNYIVVLNPENKIVHESVKR